MNLFQWKNYTISEYVMGTVQLGTPYGINNKSGQPDLSESKAILTHALERGINTFDTAQAYGTSEFVLGQGLTEKNAEIHVISKLHPTLDPNNSVAVYESIHSSVQTLGRPLMGMMLHRFEWLDNWEYGVGQALLLAKSEGLIQEIGVSVYHPEEAKAALLHPDISMIQVPFNAWDFRMRRHGVFDLARQLEKCCFCRSVYLQGVLLMTPQELEKKLPIATKVGKTWNDLCKETGLSPRQLALSMAKVSGFPLVIGAETQKQVDDNADLFDLPTLPDEVIDTIDSQIHPMVNSEMINPSLWK